MHGIGKSYLTKDFIALKFILGLDFFCFVHGQTFRPSADELFKQRYTLACNKNLKNSL